MQCQHSLTWRAELRAYPQRARLRLVHEMPTGVLRRVVAISMSLRGLLAR